MSKTYTMACMLVILAPLAVPAWAQTVKPKTLERASETYNLARCKLAWLENGGTSTRSVTYFQHMATCLGTEATAR